MADVSRTQMSGPGPALTAQSPAAPTRPPDISTNLEKDGASAPSPNHTVSPSSLYPPGKGTKTDFWSGYLTLNQQDSQCKNSMLSKNMISVSVQNSRLKRDGSMENATLSHMALFKFLISKFGLNMEEVVSINSSNMSSVIHNNLLKHICFINEEYDTDHMVGDHFHLGHYIFI